MTGLEYIVARITEQLRRRLLAGEQLTEAEMRHLDIFQQRTLSYPGWGGVTIYASKTNSKTKRARSHRKISRRSPRSAA